MVDNSVNISDSVITGDVTNIVHTNRVTCEVCKATGNLTIFTCSEEGCKKTFCEHCRSSSHPNICETCNDEIPRKKEGMFYRNYLDNNNINMRLLSTDQQTEFTQAKSKIRQKYPKMPRGEKYRKLVFDQVNATRYDRLHPNQNLTKNNKRSLSSKITRIIIIANIACVVSIGIVILLVNL